MLLLMTVAAVVSVTQLTALGSWGRSVRWTTVLQAVLVGYLVCGPVTIALQWVWTRAFAAMTGGQVADVQTFASWTVDPLIEELVKVAPLLLLAWRRPREHRQLGWTDHLLLGAGLGMGFELLEAALRFARLGGLTMRLGDGFLVQASLGGSVTVPSLGTSLTSRLPVPAAFTELLGTGGGDTIQHLVWSAFAALGIAWLARRQDGLRWIGVVPLVLVALDHANYNARITPGSGVDGPLSDLLAAMGGRLSWLLLPALLAAVAADRVLQARTRRLRPDVLLRGETANGLNPLPALRIAVVGAPWSTWVTWQVVLSRRAAVTALAAGLPKPHLDGVADVVRQLERPATQELWQRAARRVRDVVRPRTLLTWRMAVWLTALVPAAAYLVVGGFPQTSGLQRALTGRVGLWLMVAALVAGLLLTVTQLPRMWVRLHAVADPCLHERRLRPGARLATAVGSSAAGTVCLVLALVSHDARSPLVSRYHVLDAISDALLITGIALLVLSFLMFPPSLLLAAGAGGVLVPVGVAVTSDLVIGLTAAGLLGSLGIMLDEAAGDAGGAGGGAGPPRFTDNATRTRTYGSSVSDIQGQASRWAARMRRRGFTADVPPVRYGKYGWADVTVKAVKGGQEYIRHFIYKGGG